MDASKTLISRKSSSVSILSSDNIEVDFQDDNDDEGACSSSYACCPQQVLPEYDEIDSIVHFSFGIHVLHLIMIKMRHLIR